MADTSAPTFGQTDQPTNRGRNNRSRGGRGGNRVPREGQDAEQPQGGNRNSGRSRGRGGRARGGAAGTHQPSDATPQPTTEQQIQAKGKALALVPQTEDGDDVEAEVCFICASPVVHQSVAPCNHRTCHICSLRLRALYKTKTCAHCRTSAEEVIFTDDPTKRYEDYNIKEFTQNDDNLGIHYESQDIFEDTILLLRYNCPDPSCDAACLGWPDLHRHVKSVHHKQMCDLCTRNKKVFTHEHDLFTVQDLRRHEKHGDDIPGAENQSGFKGHPECGFCRQRFYGDDELFSHCRDRHERCHLCDRRDGGRHPQYYVDYNALEVHFRKDHFVCPDQECLEKKFVVFDSEMDLKAHQLEAHPNGLTKDARRDARRVDISGFDYRAPHQQDRPQRNNNNNGGSGNNRERRGGGRGRDPNADPLPVSSAQPMGRAEMAYQRQMAIQSAQSVSNRSFGGQLTQQTETFVARAPANTPAPATVTASRPVQDTFPSLGSLSLQPSSATPRNASPDRSMAGLTPQEQARRLRHNAVNERAANLLRNDQTKLAEFRNKVSFYRQGTVTAEHLIDAFFALFDTSSAELGKLIKELADIFEIATKRDNLLKAWNNWRSINEDYPSLPHGASGQSGPTTSAASVLGNGIGSKRILNLKSSTAQSSRSNNTRSYGSAVAPHSSGNPSSSAGLSFPPLSASSRSSTPAAPPVRVNPTQASWLNSAPASARPTPQPSRSATPSNSKPPGRGGDAFPSLPKAQKPTSTVFSPGYTGAGVRRVNAAGPSTVAWASGSGGMQSPPAVEESPEQRTIRKGKQGKKQVLFNWG